jgi:hypothetical protein
MGSPECQSAAGEATAMKGQGVGLSVFTTMMKDGSLVVYGNGAALQDVERAPRSWASSSL